MAGKLARTDCAWVTELTAQHTAKHNNNTDKLKVVLTQIVFEDKVAFSSLKTKNFLVKRRVNVKC